MFFWNVCSGNLRSRMFILRSALPGARGFVRRPRSRGVEGRPEPVDLARLYADNVEAARRVHRQAHQEVPGCENKAPLLDRADTGGRPAEGRARALSHLDEDQRAVPLAHDQVDFAAAAAGRPIIARYEPQPRRLQVGKGAVLGGIAGLLGGGRLPGEIH